MNHPEKVEKIGGSKRLIVPSPHYVEYEHIAILALAALVMFLVYGGMKYWTMDMTPKVVSCDAKVSEAYANGAIMAQRAITECEWMSEEGLNDYRDNPTCDAKKIAKDLYDANLEAATR